MFIFPAPYVAAGGMTVSFIASSTSSGSDTITAPASINAGDLLLLVDSCFFEQGGGVPTGFTSITSAISTFVDTLVSYKIADGTEDSSSITGQLGYISYEQVKLMLQFRGSPAISSVTPQDIATQITDGNPTSQTCNAGSGQAPLIVIGSYGSNAPVDPRTFSTTADGEISDSDFHAYGMSNYLKYKIYNSSPADTTIDMDDEGIENNLISFYLELA